MADAQTAESPQTSRQVVLVLRNLLAERYPGLGEHVNTVSTLSEVVAGEVGLPDGELDALKQAALLHDIGKLALPESILVKPGPLSEDEWRAIRLHPVTGAQTSPRLVSAGRSSSSFAQVTNASTAAAIRMGLSASRFHSAPE